MHTGVQTQTDIYKHVTDLANFLPKRYLHYNTEIGSFHTKKLCSILYSIELEF